jgi:hypothetical protein
MHQVTKEECDSVPLAHRTVEPQADLSRKHRLRKGSINPFCQNETTPEPNELGQTKRRKGEMQREDSTCLHGRKGPRCKTSGGGASMCIHGRRKSRCKECGGAAAGRRKQKLVGLEANRLVTERTGLHCTCVIAAAFNEWPQTIINLFHPKSPRRKPG